MRVIFLVLCFLWLHTLNLSGQQRADVSPPSLFVDADINYGLMKQQFSAYPLATNYPSVVNPYSGKLSFSKGTNQGANLQIGYYFDKKRTIGIGVGISYSKQSSTLGLDTFHAEFKAIDYKDNAFRQVISTDHPIAETISRTSISIPLLLRYKKDLSSKLFLTIDAGLLYNIQSQNTWSTNANFNYEAIYEFTGSGTGTIYDNSPVPGTKDFLITKNQFLKNTPGGNVDNYFSALSTTGYSVGLNEKVKNGSGNFNLAPNSLQYTVAAALNIKITGRIFLKLGGYYLSQSFNSNSKNENLYLTNNIYRNSAGQDIGVSYNPLINSIKTIQNTSYGITGGIKIFLNGHSSLDY